MSGDHFLELDGSTVTYEQFRQECLVPNRPAIVRNATAEGGYFSLPALQAALDPAQLVRTLGRRHKVPVYTVPNIHCASACRTDSSNSDTTIKCDGDRIDDNHDEADDNCGCEERELGSVLDAWCDQWHDSPHTETVWYLKDWHFQRDLELSRAAAATTTAAGTGGGSATPATQVLRSSEGGLYRVPHFLGPDWMDPFCQAVVAAATTTAVDDHNADGAAPMRGFGTGQSDYRFVYMGVPNTWTVLHHDVFGTYSWSLNVCGDKLWFFPTRSGNEFLRQHLVRGFPTPPDVRVLTGFELDAFVQHPGDLVFVPALFFHQVHNVSGTEFAVPCANASPMSTVALTISVNHNWCNQFCVEKMMNLLMDNAHDLSRLVSAEDLETVFDVVGRAACADKLDEMLHSGSNWSLAAGTDFVTFCRDHLQQLAAPVATPSCESLFCFEPSERPAALALTERLLEELIACKANLYSDTPL